MLTKFEHWRMCALNYKGWRRAFFAFLLGAFSVLALPPIHFVPALVPSFVGLIWMLDGSVTGPVRNWRYVIKQHIFNGAFAIGWWFGLGFFSAGLYWISFSFLVIVLGSTNFSSFFVRISSKQAYSIVYYYYAGASSTLLAASNVF